MNRFHVHVSVENLDQSIRFYSALFGSSPTRTEQDYAKWMLDDPALNFAISEREGNPGINHLGLQVDDEGGLAALRERARAADLTVLDEPDAQCCYARSEKHWVTDPQGVAWEHFHTLGEIAQYGSPRPQLETACCAGDGSAAQAR